MQLYHHLSRTLVLFLLRLFNLFKRQRHGALLSSDSLLLLLLLLPEYLSSLDLNAVQILELRQADDDLVHCLFFEKAHVERDKHGQGAQRGYHLVMLDDGGDEGRCKITEWKGFWFRFSSLMSGR